MKTLSDGRIQVEAGDTLSGIYGSNWKAISGYTGDPTKLQIGTILPPKQSSASLGGTLPPVGGGTKELPETPTDHLSSFKNLIQKVSKRATQEATQGGIGAMGAVPGFDPSKVSGGTLKGILDFVGGQKTTGIADIYKSTVELLDTQQKQAQDQLQIMINTGAIAEAEDRTLEKLSSMADWPLDYLQQIRTAIKTKSEAKQTDAGRITQLNQTLKNKIGKDGKVSAQDYIAAYKEWIGLNGTISDFKYAYPVEEWLGEWEWKNLPQEWRPSTKVADVKSLSSEQQIFINQVQQSISNLDITYDEAVSKYPDIAVYLKPE